MTNGSKYSIKGNYYFIILESFGVCKQFGREFKVSNRITKLYLITT